MSRKDLQEEWRKLSTPWIKEAREGRNPTRTGLLDLPMLSACGHVKGLCVLDCGCGEGRFCRMVAARGAACILGIDLCEPMIEAAKEIQSENESYQVADAQDLSFLENESFDLAISYLNQCDLPDFNANNKEVYRVLKPRGRFVIANLHPMRSAAGIWHKNNNGEKQHVILDDYFDESARHWKMMGVDFTNFHRTLSTYLDGFFNVGFALEKIIEPTVTEEQVKQYPELGDECRVPNFIIYTLRKTS